MYILYDQYRKKVICDAPTHERLLAHACFQLEYDLDYLERFCTVYEVNA